MARPMPLAAPVMTKEPSGSLRFDIGATPAEQMAFSLQEHKIDGKAEKSKRENSREHLGHAENALHIENKIADSAAARDHLRDDGNDQRDTEADPHARQDARHRCRQYDRPERPHPGHAKRPAGVDQHRVDTANAAVGVQKDRKQARKEHHKDLHLIVDAEEQDGYRYVCRARNWSDELRNRLEQAIDKRHASHQQSQGNRDQGRQSETNANAPQRRPQALQQRAAGDALFPGGQDRADSRH